VFTGFADEVFDSDDQDDDEAEDQEDEDDGSKGVESDQDESGIRPSASNPGADAQANIQGVFTFSLTTDPRWTIQTGNVRQDTAEQESSMTHTFVCHRCEETKNGTRFVTSSQYEQPDGDYGGIVDC